MITRDMIEGYKSSQPFITVPNPKKEIEHILTKALSPDPFSGINSISLYYIAGVGDISNEQVIFEPEFLYVVDLGLTYCAGIVLPYKVKNLGDPSFPDFSLYELRSIIGKTDKELIFPAVAGELLVTVKSGTSQSDVIRELSNFARSVVQISETFYKLEVKPFDEPKAIKNIETISFVRYAELNGIIRLIDFEPGWRVTQVL